MIRTFGILLFYPLDTCYMCCEVLVDRPSLPKSLSFWVHLVGAWNLTWYQSQRSQVRVLVEASFKSSAPFFFISTFVPWSGCMWVGVLWSISGLPTSSQELKLTSLWSNAKLLYMHGQEVGERLVLLFLLRECSVWPFCMSSPRFHLPVAHRRQQDKKCKNHYIVAYECGLPTGWP